MKAHVYRPNGMTNKTEKMLKDNRVSIIVDTFHGVNWWEKTKVFPTFVVYNKPKDFPDKVVVRLFDGKSPTRIITVSDTLEKARETIPYMFNRVGRDEKDDMAIIETWL